MALVSKRYKFIWFHNPKTGGTSVGQALVNAHNFPETRINRVKARFPKKQRVAKGVIDYFPSPLDVTPTLKHVTVNAAKDKINSEKFAEYFKFAFVRNPWDRIYSAYRNTLRDRPAKTPPFNEWLLSRRKSLLSSQMDFLSDDGQNIVVDFIGRYETLRKDWQIVSTCIFEKQVPLAHLNIGAAGEKSYRDIYTAETRQIIADKYATEIEILRYKF